MDIKIKITRLEDQMNQTEPVKIIGLTVVDLDNQVNSIYHETVLDKNQIVGKTAEQCIDIAYSQLSSSLAESYDKLKNINNSIIGSIYIPN